jgi:alkanesulfonate monooxygenase SsuD/methylene tetrahydromethanopterin reductase-like flavin-dependent oxidoreductase (luciferase family)
MITGIQLQTWAPAPDLVGLARLASRRFETVWLTDQFQSRNIYALLGAIASQVNVSVATGVTFPFGHNPLATASAFATVLELASPSHRVIMGLGSGGPLAGAVMAQPRRVTRVRELISLVRGLWSGEAVSLDDFPVTGAAVGFRPGAKVALTVPVTREIPIVVTGTGPRILELAGEVADGVLMASNFPPHSLGAFRSGRFARVSGLDAVERGRSRSSRERFARIFGVNVSVADDRAAAQAAARRQAALIIGAQPEQALAAAGIDVEEIQGVKAAFREGAGVAGAADRLPQRIADELVVSGTPADVIAGMSELLGYAAAAGFTEAYVGAPVGPQPAEAIRLLGEVVLPEVARA